MYPVSEAFLQAVQGNTRKYYWTGKITTAGGVEYPFDQEDIVKGSGYITAQCCGNSEIELGRCMRQRWGSACFWILTGIRWRMRRWNYPIISGLPAAFMRLSLWGFLR